ncbi:MAG: XRE family transcriptional regulator [Gammaproteobacteria bacterium]|nr:XRE family transcriptional regulator [Gammaproteobacteria bacterium]
MFPNLIQDVISTEGLVSTDRLADRLHITKQELATATGLSKDAVTKTARANSSSTQRRLRETVEIINRILPWAGSLTGAFAWYRSQPLPSLGDKTAEELVKEGQVEMLRRYLSRIADGGYA